MDNSFTFKQLFCDVLLGEILEVNDVVGDEPNSESYRSLVKRGVLIDSSDDASPFFILTVPELYLYKWALTKRLNVEVRSLLWQILRTRYELHQSTGSN